MRVIGNFVVILTSIIVALFLFELVLRFKNHFVAPIYDIEMWRYSKELKVQVSDHGIGHVHLKNAQSELQRVMIETNEVGTRGAEILPVADFENNVLFIGSSVVLGWGVDNSSTMSSQIQTFSTNDGKDWQVVNAGVGNYNAKRAISNYLTNLSDLGWDTVVYGYFVNDAEHLLPNDGNFFTRNFMVGVLMWKFLATIIDDLPSLDEYYRSVYNPENTGFIEMKASLARLGTHCNDGNIRCVVAMIPDIHQTQPYKLQFIHEKIHDLTLENGMEFLDLLPVLQDKDPEQLWNKYNDPHPNDYAHKLMGDAIYRYLSLEN